jgi:hypothetical protein
MLSTTIALQHRQGCLQTMLARLCHWHLDSSIHLCQLGIKLLLSCQLHPACISIYHQAHQGSSQVAYAACRLLADIPRCLNGCGGHTLQDKSSRCHANRRGSCRLANLVLSTVELPTWLDGHLLSCLCCLHVAVVANEVAQPATLHAYALLLVGVVVRSIRAWLACKGGMQQEHRCIVYAYTMCNAARCVQCAARG